MITPDVHDDNRSPFAVRYVASVGRTIAAAYADLEASPQHDPGIPGSANGASNGVGNGRPPLLLVGHSAAGPLLPSLGATQRAAGRRVRGYVFCDAHLPRRDVNRLQLLEADDPQLAAGLRDHLDRGGLYPEWSFEALARVVPDADERRELLSELRPRGLGFFTEQLTMPEDWPDAPCGYLQTSAAYAGQARSAHLRGWPVRAYGEGHFLPLTDPAGLAGALQDLLTAL